MTDIITLTMNPALDKSTSVERVAPEMKLRCERPDREPGGGGINVSRVVTRLGGASRAVFPAGGYTGDMLVDLLQAEDLTAEVVPVKNTTRENLVVYERTSEQQFRFGMPGAPLDESEVQACLVALESGPDPAFIVASGSLPEGVPDDFYCAVAHKAKSRGAKLIVDSSGAPLRRVVREAGVYLLKPNLRELRYLTDRPIETETQQIEAAQSLVDDGHAEVVVVSIGAGGAFMFTAEGHQHLRAPTVTIRSTVGAGDSMVAGMVTGLVRGEPIKRAVQLGIAAGSATVMSPGTQLCDPDDVKRLFELITT